jgi:hypothetical protein
MWGGGCNGGRGGGYKTTRTKAMMMTISSKKMGRSQRDKNEECTNNETRGWGGWGGGVKVSFRPSLVQCDSPARGHTRHTAGVGRGDIAMRAENVYPGLDLTTRIRIRLNNDVRT